MKWPARALLFFAALAPPGYLLLDHFACIPLEVRDRPWPLALAAVLCCLFALRLCPALRRAALLVALLSPCALAGVAYLRYRLPPAAPSAGVGAPLPDVTLPDELGNQVHLGELRQRPTLLIWFRGSWCPYCRRQLAELTAELAHHPGGGVRLLAVSPDPPEPLRALKRELKLTFPLLSDPDRRLVNRCDAAHCAAIVDGQGIVRWAVISGNWEKDLPARALLQAAYRQN